MESEISQLTVDRNRLGSFFPVIGLELDRDGYIKDVESGEIIRTDDGEKLNVDEVGYIGVDDMGDPVTVRDSLSDVVANLSDREIRE